MPNRIVVGIAAATNRAVLTTLWVGCVGTRSSSWRKNICAVPSKVLRGGAEANAVKKMEFFAVAAFEPAGVGAPFGEDFVGYDDPIARVDGPEPFIEHPVGVASKC